MDSFVFVDYHANQLGWWSPYIGLVATRATVTSNQQAIVNDTGGIISSKIDTYSVTANGQTNTLSQWAQVTADVDDAYELQWGLKGTVAGLTGGIGFYNDGNVTQFTVQSDRFAIIDPRNDQVKSVFTTIVNDPVLPDGVYIDTAFIKAAIIQELVAGDVNADTVTAGISITSPNINGGSFVGSSYTALAGSYKFDVVPGSSIPLWFGLAAQSRTISNAKFALQNNGNITARGINIYDNSNNLILAANGNINGAYVNNLSVGTLDIQGNAVTVPVYIETASVLTNGGWTTILDQTITQDIASTIFASFDILTERVGDVSGVYDTIDLKLEMYEGTTTVVRTILFEQLGADQEAGVIARHLHSISGGAYIDATNYRLKITGRSRNASTQPYRFSAKGFSTSAKR